MRNMWLKHYWKLVMLSGVIVYGISLLIAAVQQRMAQLRIAQVVQAAGKLPSFELTRTERLKSKVHQDKVTIVTTMARRADGAEMTQDTIYARPGRPLVERKMIFPSGAYVEVDDHTRAKSTFYYDPNDPKFLGRRLMRRDMSVNCSRPLDHNTDTDWLWIVTAIRLWMGAASVLAGID